MYGAVVELDQSHIGVLTHNDTFDPVLLELGLILHSKIDKRRSGRVIIDKLEGNAVVCHLLILTLSNSHVIGLSERVCIDMVVTYYGDIELPFFEHLHPGI